MLGYVYVGKTSQNNQKYMKINLAKLNLKKRAPNTILFILGRFGYRVIYYDLRGKLLSLSTSFKILSYSNTLVATILELSNK